MAPIRRGLVRNPYPAVGFSGLKFVSYKESTPPSNLDPKEMIKMQDNSILEFHKIKASANQIQKDKGEGSPPPPHLEKQVFSKMVASSPPSQVVELIPAPAEATLNRRSARIPKRKRRYSSSPELTGTGSQSQPPKKVDTKTHNKVKTEVGAKVKTKTKNEIMQSPHSPKSGYKTPVKEEETIMQSLLTNAPIRPSEGMGSLMNGVGVGIHVKQELDAIITPQYFEGKEEFGSAVMVLVELDSSVDYENVPFKSGWLQCGVCCNVSQITNMNISQFKKYGAYLCGQCVRFLEKMMKIAKKAEALYCFGTGSCTFPPPNGSDYCEGCFVHNCLLLLDFSDDIYFKLWRAVPPVARTNVPHAPPTIKRYARSRGNVLWVNKADGCILHISKRVINKGGGGKMKEKMEEVKKRSDSGSFNKGKMDEEKERSDSGLSNKANMVEGTKRSDSGSSNKGKMEEGQERSDSGSSSNPNKGVNKRTKTKNIVPEQNQVEPELRRRGRSGAKLVTIFPILLEETANVNTDEPSDDNTTTDMKETVRDKGANVHHSAILEESEPEPDKAIKVFPPSTSDLGDKVVEQHGYPVVVVKGSEYEPPSPLCFSCGSAGINQLVVCCTCCQPFHPYCSEDELLLSAFLSQLSIPTPNDVDLRHKFRKWKCFRCLTCSHCGRGKELDDFIGCSLCVSSFHMRCAKKMPLKPVDKEKDKWVCGGCLRCTSCSIPLTKSSHHLRKLSAESSSQPEILCLECFKRRRKGAFCPVCYVCYDDNDWDSKMMECDKCQRWIHAQCEDLNDERYFVLSALPETISFICRLCQPPSNVGWRYAVESELVEGYFRVLELFYKKAVGISRKRRALNFDPEVDECFHSNSVSNYFSPSVVVSSSETLLALQEKGNENSTIGLIPSPVEPLVVDISCKTEPNFLLSPLPTPQLSPDEHNLVKQFNIKPCIIPLIDINISSHNKLRHSPSLLVRDDQHLPIPEARNVLPCSPMKLDTSFIMNLTSPQKMNTPHRVLSSFTDAVKASAPLWGSVRDFRSISLALLPPCFVDLTQNNGKYDEDAAFEAKFLLMFEDTLKQVFPWWREELKELPCKKKEKDLNCLMNSFNVINEDAINEELIDENDELIVLKQLKDEDFPDAIVFEQVYWDNVHFLDGRICSLCGENGDFPLNSCGRLLNVNPEAWVHVNCVIWSSEVWEEEDGALQQVEVALLRGKKTECTHCSKIGASLNCCFSSCRKCFHFQCAVDSGCILESSKSVFCSMHSGHAKGQVQKDMHVTRKVFVNGIGGTSLRKKELVLSSNRLKLFVGSTRVDRLGYLVPLSVINTEDKPESNASRLLLPVNFQVTFLRLLKSIEGFKLGDRKYDVLNWRSTLNKGSDFHQGNLPSAPSNFSVVIDHATRPDKIRRKLKQATDFWNWEKNVNRYIDEFNVEWTPNYKPPSHHKKTWKPSSSDMSKNLIYRTTLEWRPLPCNKLEESLLEAALSQPRLGFLLEQLPGLEGIPSSYSFRYCDPCRLPEDIPVSLTPSGSAKTEPFSTRRPHDMFNWLRSQHRKPPLMKLSGFSVSEETIKSKGLPMAMRFRNLRVRATKDLVVLPSHIHGRGLFAQRDLEVGEMLIEYAGEMIRSVLCDVRERKYEQAGIGCYMFRVNSDLVVDATLKGNAARFINHSCDPNCESKAVKILGKDHILIFALKNIGRGEELTYDYKFEREVDKLPCSCGARRCRRFLN